MALIQVNYLSNALARTVPVNVILPTDKVDSKTHRYAKRTKPFKTQENLKPCFFAICSVTACLGSHSMIAPFLSFRHSSMSIFVSIFA